MEQPFFYDDAERFLLRCTPKRETSFGSPASLNGLDIMVASEEPPAGTPGCSRADLQGGAFVYGERMEKDGESPPFPHGEVREG